MTAPKQSVSVRIRGQEFRVLSDEDEASLQRVAGYLDQTMAKVEERTGTVDSRDVALLTGLNLAREIVQIREERGAIGFDAARVRALIEIAESAIGPDAD